MIFFFETINREVFYKKLKQSHSQNKVFSGLGPTFVNEYFW